jgi:hypothetical protein
MSGFYGLHLYDRPGFSYPPVWGYCLQILGALVHQAGGTQRFFSVVNPDLLIASVTTGDFRTTVTSPAFNLMFKSVLFGFDLAAGLMIYRFVLLAGGNNQRARLAFTAWFLNPYVIYESAVHGSADTIVGFSVLAAVLLILYGRPLWAGVGWATAIMTKLVPIVLGFELVAGLVFARRSRNRAALIRLAHLALFGLGTLLGALLFLGPEILNGSVQGIALNTFHRASEPVTIGGLSFAGIRHFRQWSWLFAWAYQNSAIVVQWSSIAQAAAIVAWSGWTLVVVRKSPVFGLLTGTIGSLASLMLLSPLAQPQYISWWLPVLVVLVFLTDRGHWQLALLAVAPLVFSVGILGPAAYLAPLATYTHVLPATDVSYDVASWYTAPGRLWGETQGDDFMALGSIVTVVAIISLFGSWLGAVLTQTVPQFRVRSRA